MRLRAELAIWRDDGPGQANNLQRRKKTYTQQTVCARFYSLTGFVFSNSKQDTSSKHFKFGRKHQIRKSLVQSKVVPTTSSLE